MTERGDFDPDAITVSGEHFIDGALTNAGDPEIEVLRPSDHRRIGVTYDASEATVDRAVTSAAKAYKTSGWADQPPRERAKVLRNWAQVIEANAETLARIESAGSTRLINEVRLRDVVAGADLIRYYAEYADKLEGVITPTGSKALSLVVNEPYGVVGAIIPWNFPLINACMKIAPALGGGQCPGPEALGDDALLFGGARPLVGRGRAAQGNSQRRQRPWPPCRLGDGAPPADSQDQLHRLDGDGCADHGGCGAGGGQAGGDGAGRQEPHRRLRRCA